MWWAAELFVYPAIVRLRQIGEHGTAKDRAQLDPRLNTGTTVAPFWQRVFIAPNDVNYHLEHHMFASIPPYRLKRLHQLLASRGYYDGFECISKDYFDVIRRAVRSDEKPAMVPAE
jgi:fatty acid desaturase